MTTVNFELSIIDRNIELATSIDDVPLQLDMYNMTFNRLLEFFNNKDKEIRNDSNLRYAVCDKLLNLIDILNSSNPILKLPYKMYLYIRPFCTITKSPIEWTTMHNSSVSRFIDVSEKFYLLFKGYLSNNVDNAYYMNIIHDILNTIQERKIYQTDNEILLKYIKAQLKSIINRLYNIERIIMSPDKTIIGRYNNMSVNEHMERVGLDKIEDISLDEINNIVNNKISEAEDAIIKRHSASNIRQDIADEFEKFLSDNVNVGGLCIRYGGYELYYHADELIAILNRIKEVK